MNRSIKEPGSASASAIRASGRGADEAAGGASGMCVDEDARGGSGESGDVASQVCALSCSCEGSDRRRLWVPVAPDDMSSSMDI